LAQDPAMTTGRQKRQKGRTLELARSEATRLTQRLVRGAQTRESRQPRLGHFFCHFFDMKLILDIKIGKHKTITKPSNLEYFFCFSVFIL
jgi:hypothetical protein